MSDEPLQVGPDRGMSTGAHFRKFDAKPNHEMPDMTDEEKGDMEGEELSEHEKNFNKGKSCLVFGEKEDIPYTGVGNILRGLRIEASQTLGAVSKFMGIKVVEYSSLEMGRTYPSVEQAKKLSEFYNIGEDILIAEMALEAPQFLQTNDRVYPWSVCMQLRAYIKGSSSYGSLIFRLIQKADAINKTKLRSAYPVHFRIFERWQEEDGDGWLKAMVDRKDYTRKV